MTPLNAFYEAWSWEELTIIVKNTTGWMPSNTNLFLVYNMIMETIIPNQLHRFALLRRVSIQLQVSYETSSSWWTMR